MRLRALLALAVTFIIILDPTRAAADPTGRYLYVTPTAGVTYFDGNIRFPNQSLDDAAYWGARLGYTWWPWLAFEGAFGFSSTSEQSPGTNDVSFSHFSGNLVFSHYTGVLGGPFLSLGAGASKLSPKDKNATINFPGAEPGDVNQGNLELAGGWMYWATDRLGVRVEGREILWLPQKNWAKLDPLTHTLTATAAITYTFGSKARDTDLDAVPDRADKCPGTPHGATVDATGCPKDSDGDGVLDGIDRCPATPKGCKIDSTGCETDADGDKVCDGIDQCPDTPHGATVDSAGCPHDSDGDGVLDGIDQCANTPKGAKVDATGCPIDTDRDGVPDGLDQCPGTALGIPVDSTGCPMGYREHEQQLLDTGMIRLSNVQFATGKAVLQPASFAVLDVVGDLLSKWPELKIEIAGHTDSKGSKKTNEKLSQARADSVRAYLLRRFPEIQPSQFVAKGYGPTRPIASNDNEAGRALNRRVEFVVQNREVLIHESQKRSQPGIAPSDSTRAPSVPLPETTPAPAPKELAPAPAPAPQESAPAPAPAPAPPAPTPPDTSATPNK